MQEWNQMQLRDGGTEVYSVTFYTSHLCLDLDLSYTSL